MQKRDQKQGKGIERVGYTGDARKEMNEPVMNGEVRCLKSANGEMRCLEFTARRQRERRPGKREREMPEKAKRGKRLTSEQFWVWWEWDRGMAGWTGLLRQ